MLTASFFVPLGAPQAGWTTLPAAVDDVGTPGLGQTLWTVAIFVTGASSIMGAVNYITTVIRLRAPGMSYFRMPLTVWGLWLTSILNALFVPVLAAGMVLLFFDRVFGTQFFIAGTAIQRRRRSDPLPAPVLDLRPPRGLHPDPAGLGHRRRTCCRSSRASRRSATGSRSGR